MADFFIASPRSAFARLRRRASKSSHYFTSKFDDIYEIQDLSGMCKTRSQASLPWPG